MTGADAAGVPQDVVAWIEGVAGGDVLQLQRQAGGGRKEAWFVDVDGGAETRALFLRFDRSDPGQTADPWTIHREAVFHRALAATPIPVPALLAVHPERQAMLSERVAGVSAFSSIHEPARRVAVASRFIEHLAQLHRIDPSTLELDGMHVGEGVREHVLRELDEWEWVIAQRGGHPDAALSIALQWLRANVPAGDVPLVLVQGDTGPGNFLFVDNDVTAIVDWEFAHLGDPMDDIAWLMMRAAQDPMPDLPGRLREYEARSGYQIDLERVRYYQVMAETKLQVMMYRPGGLAARYAERSVRDVGNALIYGDLHRRMWFVALGAVFGIDAPVVEHTVGEVPQTQWLYDVVLESLRHEVAPYVTEPVAARRAKSTARIVKYLAAVSADRANAEQRELDGLAAVLGERPASVAAGRAAAAERAARGALDAPRYLRHAWEVALRDAELMRGAAGVLARRNWPTIGSAPT